MRWLLVWPGRMVLCLHWTSRWQTWQTSLRQSRLNFPRLPWTEYFPGHIRACQNIAKHNGMPYCLIAFDLRAWQVGYSLLLFTCYELESLFSNFVFFSIFRYFVLFLGLAMTKNQITNAKCQLQFFLTFQLKKQRQGCLLLFLNWNDGKKNWLTFGF